MHLNVGHILGLILFFFKLSQTVPFASVLIPWARSGFGSQSVRLLLPSWCSIIPVLEMHKSKRLPLCGWVCLGWRVWFSHYGIVQFCSSDLYSPYCWKPYSNGLRAGTSFSSKAYKPNTLFQRSKAESPASKLNLNNMGLIGFDGMCEGFLVHDQGQFRGYDLAYALICCG